MNTELLVNENTVTFPQPEPAPQAPLPGTPPPSGLRKLRCDAFWNTLDETQKQKLQEWLLEQNLGFRETHARGQKELGLTCSLSTIGRIYQYLLKTRAMDELRQGASAIEELSQSSPKLDDLRKTSLQLIGVRLLQKTMEHHDVKELCAMGKLLLQSQERDIQQERLRLARERQEFKAAHAALKILPQMENFNKEEEERDLARIEVIKRALFGREVDFIEKVPPEQKVNFQPR